MDNLRGQFSDAALSGETGSEALDALEDEIGSEAPPRPVGVEERRLQVRAYNHWIALLGQRQFPAISQLHIETLDEFAPHSVLLDLREDIANPTLLYVGAQLLEDIEPEGPLARLADVPSRSLLSRITDHYLQILANQAPIGFEAEFTNQLGQAVMYRGILLPFSEDDRTITHILGLINGKKAAEPALAQALEQALELELGQMLPDTDADEADGDEADSGPAPAAAGDAAPSQANDNAEDPAPLPGWLVQWAERSEAASEPAPAQTPPAEMPHAETPPAAPISSPVMQLAPAGVAPLAGAVVCPAEHGAEAGAATLSVALPTLPGPAQPAAPDHAADHAPGPVIMPVALANALAKARAAVEAITDAPEALLPALSAVHEVVLAARAAPQALALRLAEQAIAPETLPMPHGAPEGAALVPGALQLAFGAGHPALRPAAHRLLIDHALRLGLPAGALEPYVATAPGGLAGVMAEARRLSRIARGQFAPPAGLADAALAARLDALPALALADLPADGEAVSLLVARRDADGALSVVGEVTRADLVEAAARALLR